MYNNADIRGQLNTNTLGTICKVIRIELTVYETFMQFFRLRIEFLL